MRMRNLEVDTQPLASDVMPLLHLRHVNIEQGDVHVLENINLDVFEGEIVCVIGPNGAGKSILFKTIYGFIKPRSGTIRFSTANITGLEPSQILAYGMGYVPQERTTFPDMTVEENLQLGMYIIYDRRRVRAAMQRVFEIFPRLAERRKQKARQISSGEQRLLEIGRALMPEPRLILLDEPSAGLAPVITKQMFTSIYTLNKDFGLTILLIEQNAHQALAISHRGYVLEGGTKRFEGSSRALLNNPEIQQHYLGQFG
jgi:ABC-type branched-subunit amino acid transport system ATPase component